MTDMTTRFAAIVGAHHILTGDAISDDYAHDEVLTKPRNDPRTWPSPRPPTSWHNCSGPPRKTTCR